MKHLFLLALLAIQSFSRAAWGKDAALELADFLFAHQDYEAAITEYERFVFFHPGDHRVGDAHFQVGVAHRAIANWEQSVRAFRRSIQCTEKSSLRDERRIELGITLIASGQYDAAHLELLQVSQFSENATLHRRAFYFHGVAYLYAFKWKKAQESFAEYYRESAMSPKWKDGQQVDDLLHQAQALPYKSTKVARRMSTILPGAGQLYAGEWKKAFNALTVSSLTTFAVFHSATEGDYVDAALLLTMVFNRYYLGNRFHAEKAVEEYNDRLDRQHAARVLAVLLANRAELPQSP